MIESRPVRLCFGACGENMPETHYIDENGEFAFLDLVPGNSCVIRDFELKICGYAGNFPTTAISRKLTLEAGTKSELVWFGFGDLSGRAKH